MVKIKTFFGIYIHKKIFFQGMIYKKNTKRPLYNSVEQEVDPKYSNEHETYNFFLCTQTYFT